MKKFSDIYSNLEEKISLKQKESFLLLKEKLKKNIDNLSKNLKKKIILKEKRNFKIKEKLKKNIEPFSKKLNTINLVKKIKKQNKIFYFLNYSFKNFLSNNTYSKNYRKDFFKRKKIALKKFYNKNLNFNNIDLTKKKIKIPKASTLRIISFLFLIIAFVLLDKIIVETLISSGVKNLYNLKVQKNIENIEISLSKAKTKFNIANILFTPFKIIPEKNLQNAKNIIYVLQDTTQIGLDLVELYKANFKFIKNKKLNEIYFANLLYNNKYFFLEKEKNLENIRKNLEKINFDKDSEYYKKLDKLKSYLDRSLLVFKVINKNYDTFLSILGKDKEKKYLIVFQNNDEIRPTGGFMGSAGIIKIFAGKVTSFEKKDIYALEWDSKVNYTESVKGPSGINLLSKRLGLRDSNAFIDFQTSAKSINYFMKKAGYNLDGVIFLNQKPILDLLKEIGTIDFSKYKSIIDEKNFSEIISLLVEAKVSKKATLDTPKQVLFDFSELLKEKILQKNDLGLFAKIIFKNINSRDIVFINFGVKENKLLKELELNGDFNYKNQTDFNYPFFISVGGNKSDRYIKRKYKKEVKIVKNNNGNCDLISHFGIVLSHSFSKKDEDRVKENMKKFRIKENIDLINIQGKGLNQSYTKIIVPKNSILDLKTLKKYGYTVFDHKKYKTVEKLLKTKPGEKSYFNFDYTIKNIDCNSQKIAIYKQAGIYNYDLFFNYINESNLKIDSFNKKGLEKDFYQKYNLEKNQK